MASVQVVVRLRPMNHKEESEGTLPIITASTAKKSVTVIKGVGAKQARTSFSFDNVFTSFSTQQEVFSETLRPVISDVLKGFETCVFAYGQTGTGKTHTMEGSLEDPELHGVIPRAAQAIFDNLSSSRYVESQVSCSYLEIYNEELSDLLVGGSTKLDIVNAGGSKGVQCRGLSEQPVESALDVLNLMQQAQQSRRVGETRMNKQSSRSHCIFTMKISSTQVLADGSTLQSQGKLHMVDLAGSESAKTAELKESSVRDQIAREQERRNINQSLLTLGKVITSLKKKSKAIPYRESKLTRILQEALGGRCKTVIIATISPSVLNVNESLQTLQYAQAANGIKNKPVASSYMMSSASTAAAASTPSKGVGERVVAAERWQEMEIRMEHYQQEVEEARQALARNYLQQQEMEERAEKAEQAQQDLQLQVDTKNAEIVELTGELDAERAAKQLVEEKLCSTETRLSKTTAVLKATQQTEEALTHEALSLLKALKDSVDDGNSLYELVQANRDEVVQKRSATRDFVTTMAGKLQDAWNKLDEVANRDKGIRTELGGLNAREQSEQIQAIEAAQTVVSNLSTFVEEMASTICDNLATKLIPRVQTLSSEVLSGTEEARSLVARGDEHLSSCCDDARQLLVTAGEKLRELDNDHKQVAHDALSTIENAILSIKEKLALTVKQAEDGIRSAQQQSSVTRVQLDQVHQEWREASLTATGRVKSIASGQHKALGDARNTFGFELKRYDTVNSELMTQSGLLEKARNFHLNNLNSQTETLDLQQRQLKEAEECHKSLCNRVLNSVMDGVKSIISEQLNMITAEQTKKTLELVGSNRQALAFNKELECESVDTFGKMATNLAILRKETDSLHKTGASVLGTLTEGHSAARDIVQTTEKFEHKEQEFSGAVQETVTKLESVHGSIDAAAEEMVSNGHACAQFIEADTDPALNRSVRNISEVGSKVLGYVQDDVIVKTSDAINKMDEPRRVHCEELFAKIDSIKEATNSGAADVLNLVKQQVQTTTEANDQVSRSAIDFTSTICVQQKKRCKEAGLEMSRVLESGSVQDLVSGCSGDLSGANELTSSFGVGVMDMDTAVPEGPEKAFIEFSQELTATPDEETILRCCGLLDGTAMATVEDQVLGEDNVASPGSIPPVLKETSLNEKTREDTAVVKKRRGKMTSRVPKRAKRHA